MQSKLESIVEQLLNTSSGFLISYLAGQFVVYPMLHIKVSAAENFWSTVIFTVISITRGYLWRRFFNKRSAAKHSNKNNNKEFQNVPTNRDSR